MITQSCVFSRSLCMNNFPQVLLIGNQIDHVPQFRYINRADYVSNLVRGRKFLEDMKHLMRSAKRAAGR